MKNDNRFLMYFYAVMAMLCWGSTFIWFKVVLQYYNPLTVTFTRLFIASILITLYVIFTKNRQKIDRKDYKWFLLLTFFEPVCYFLGESFGLQHVSASLGSIIISTIPLVTPIMTFLFLKEKISIYGLIGLFVSFFGVLMIVLGEKAGNSSVLGISLMVFAVFSAVGYGIVVRSLSIKYSSLTIVKTQSILGMLMFLPLFYIFEWDHFISVAPNFEAISTIFKLAIFGSVLAFLFMTTVVRGIGLNNANIFTNLIPVITSVISYFVLKEVFGVQKILGIIVVISGLFVSQLPHILRHEKVVKFINRFY